jgi:hypothetical protein
VSGFDVPYRKVLEAYHLNSFSFNRVKSFLKQEGIADVKLTKKSNGFSIEISDQKYSASLMKDAPSMIISVQLKAKVDCTDSSLRSQGTMNLSVGEIMNIFGFKYIWKAPAI